LRAQYSRSLLTVTTDDPDGLIVLARAAGAEPLRDGALVVIGVEDAGVARALLAGHGEGISDFEFRHGRMDDVFLALTGRSAAEVGAR
jgi:multidrug/hemolysin transport system ATP-binding protein